MAGSWVFGHLHSKFFPPLPIKIKFKKKFYLKEEMFSNIFVNGDFVCRRLNIYVFIV